MKKLLIIAIIYSCLNTQLFASDNSVAEAAVPKISVLEIGKHEVPIGVVYKGVCPYLSSTDLVRFSLVCRGAAQCAKLALNECFLDCAGHVWTIEQNKASKYKKIELTLIHDKKLSAIGAIHGFVELKLHMRNITTAGIAKLRDLANLKELSFSSCNLSVNVFQTLVNLPFYQELETLRLDKCNINDKCLKVVLDSLPNSLTSLSINRNPLITYKTIERLEKLGFSYREGIVEGWGYVSLKIWQRKKV